jgi:hypothetical protein
VHRREVDKFYDLPSPVVDSLPPAIRQQIGNRSARLRVTYDQKTNQILGKIVKVRIADMSLHFPRQPVDCRISVNFEMRFEGDIDAIIAQSQSERHNDRSKDRLSYTQGPYQVDLTQVSMTKPHNVSLLPNLHTALLIPISGHRLPRKGTRARSRTRHQCRARTRPSRHVRPTKRVPRLGRGNAQQYSRSSSKCTTVLKLFLLYQFLEMDKRSKTGQTLYV